MTMMRIILLWLVWLTGISAVGAPRKYTIVVGTECSNSNDTISVPTVEKACEQAELWPDDTVTIDVAEGVYRLCRPIHISARRKAPLRFVGRGMGRSVLSGACMLPPFEIVSPQLWKISLDGLSAMADISQLYVGGRRAIPARTPNALCPMWRTGRVTQTVVDTVPARRSPRKGLAIQTLALNPEAYDALSTLSGQTENVRISFMHAWDMTRRYIETFDPVDSLVYIVGNIMKPWNPIDRESQFMFEGDVSFIDEPGEWCVDHVNRVLLYYPRQGETPANAVAEVPLLDHIAIIDGCDDVSFEGISMIHTRYKMPRKGDEPLQAASKVGAAVELRDASGIIIRGCEIAHTGGYGLWFDRGCHRSIAEGCLIEDLGAGGVKIGGTVLPEADSPDITSHITLNNCIVRSGGREFPTGTGVLLTHASDCVITHNEVADFYYTGISIGWVWGYGYSPSVRNYIGYNHVHHLGWGTLSDMGGIYTLGRSDSTVIEHNVVHHVYSYSYGGWGIYADEGTSGLTVRSNLVHDCKFSAFHQHYGRDNKVENNIFANQMRVQLESSSDEPHMQFSYASNIVYHTTGKMYGLRWDKSQIDRHHNLYWYAGDRQVLFGDKTLKQWQAATGNDTGSIEADPVFRNAAAGDYMPTNHRALKAIGFKPFDISEAGLQGPAEWKVRAEMNDAALRAFDRLVEYHEAHPAPELPLPVVEPKH